MKEIPNLKLLSVDEMVIKLKSMIVCENKIYPVRYFSLIVPNMEYDPDSFSQEIEDSETEIDEFVEFKKMVDRYGLFFIHNNIDLVPKNTARWHENHRKICQVEFIPNAFIGNAVFNDGVRNFYSKDILNSLQSYSNIYGGIVDFL